MAIASGKPSQPRRSLLAALTGLVLAATVGGAWLLVASAGRRARAAEEILQEIRSRGLAKLMPEKPTIRWYLVHGDSGPVGWRAQATGRIDQASFVGVDMQVVAATSAVENWTLSADATQGEYLAVERIRGRMLSRTEIAMANGRVKVLQAFPREPPGVFHAASPAPPNYLPEGLHELVISQVSARGADAQFKLVFNERPNHFGYVDYGTLRFQALTGGAGRSVRVSGARGREKHASVYTVDSAGQIREVSMGTTRLTPANTQQVIRLFPEAADRLRSQLPDILRGAI